MEPVGSPQLQREFLNSNHVYIQAAQESLMWEYSIRKHHHIGQHT